MSLAEVHHRLSNAAAFFTFIMGSWAAILALRGRGLDGSYLGAILVGELLLVAEALLGAVLLAGLGLAPARGIHLLYGLLAVLIWPFLFTATRRDGGRREAILFAAGSFFLWGLVLRAATTARLGG
jgi:hypothetical protein